MNKSVHNILYNLKYLDIKYRKISNIEYYEFEYNNVDFLIEINISMNQYFFQSSNTKGFYTDNKSIVLSFINNEIIIPRRKYIISML